MRKIRSMFVRRGGEPVVALLCFLVYAGVFGLFFGLMSINNWQLKNISRTLATTLLTWGIMSVAMHSVYGGYEVGRKKSKPIIYNMTLGVLFTDLVTYLQMQIMNVNPNNQESLTLFGEDLPWLILCFFLQAIIIAVLTRLGNEIYFRINPPKDCLIILGSMEHRDIIERKIGRYQLQWRVTDVALWDEDNLEERIDRVKVVFMADVPDEYRMPLLKLCYDLHRDVISRATLQDIMLSSAQQVVVDDAPFLEMDYHKITMSQRAVKRAMDVVLSFIVLIVLLPLLLIIAAAIKLDDGGPVLFRQRRMTGGGHDFSICKFRTMRVDEGHVQQVSAGKDDPRITRVGRFLRRTRLDELPQFWNILMGDMTLVGPRPEMLENVEKYKMELPTFVYREKVKAGLTGYAQIEGRYNTLPEDKLMLDLMYIERFSVWEDIKLLLRTFTVLFKKDSTEGFDADTKQEAGKQENKQETI